MSENTGEAPPVEKREVRLKKLIVPFEESSPAQEPLFMNYAQVAQAGGSAYIDVGVIPFDELIPGAPEVTFLVLTRLVMSLETLAGLGDQISEILRNKSAGEMIKFNVT